jgi:predicted RNase H-like HicB family nuclease
LNGIKKRKLTPQSATCPELNFVSSFGDSKKEAIKNLKDAINLMLEPIPYNLIKSKSEIDLNFLIKS